ncbi:hypothetical protein AHiyo6_25910, partial [Arthrobacter sp. Hiyo6]
MVRGQDVDGAGYLHFGGSAVDVERGWLVELVLGGADVDALGLQSLEQFDDGVLDDGPEAGEFASPAREQQLRGVMRDELVQLRLDFRRLGHCPVRGVELAEKFLDHPVDQGADHRVSGGDGLRGSHPEPALLFQYPLQRAADQGAQLRVGEFVGHEGRTRAEVVSGRDRLGGGGLHLGQRRGPAGELPNAVVHQSGGSDAEVLDGEFHGLLVLLRSSGQGDRKDAERERGQDRVCLRRLPADLGGTHEQQPLAVFGCLHCDGEFQLGKCRGIWQFDADGLERPELGVVPVAGPDLAIILAPPPDQGVDVIAKFREAAQRDPGRGLTAGDGTAAGRNDGFQDSRNGFACHRFRPVDQAVNSLSWLSTDSSWG